MNLLKKIVINIKNKVLSSPFVINKNGSGRFSEAIDVDNGFIFTGSCSNGNRRKFNAMETSIFQSETKKEISKEEMSSLTFAQVCERMSLFNIKVDIKPNEWDAFFGVIYNHLASKNLEKNTGRLVSTICAHIMMNRVAIGVNFIENTITFETIVKCLDNALNRIMQYGNYYELTSNDCYKITNRIRMYLKSSRGCNCYESFSKCSDSSGECLVYNFEDYYIKVK